MALYEKTVVVKKVRSDGLLTVMALNVYSMAKMIVLIVWSLLSVFVQLYQRLALLCRKRRRNAAVAPREKSHGKASDYPHLIMELKNLKESLFYSRFQAVFQFYEHNSASIEVDHRERIYSLPFIYVPYFRDLPKQIKIDFNDTVDRTSRESKVRSLIFDHERFISSSKYTNKVKSLMKKIPVINVLFDYYFTLGLLVFLITIVINISIVIAYSTAEEALVRSLKHSINDLGWVNVGLTSFLVLMIFLQNIPEAVDIASRPISLLVKLQNLFKLFFSSGILYYTLYVVFTVLGNTLHPFFHSYTLTDAINRFSAMKIIFQAIYIPRKSLVLTLLLIVVLCYVFSIIWYSSMADILRKTKEIYGKDDPLELGGKAYCCQNLLLCFICFINNLIKEDAKMAITLAGGALQKPNNMNYTIFAFDNIALILLKLLLLEILAGLIIDTFGALRDLDISKNEDVKGSCFICGLAVEEFERPNCSGFEVHIAKEHYMWNYICYLAYLIEKPTEDYDGIEEYISRQMSVKSVGWVPNKKTMAFDKEATEALVFDNIERADGSIVEMIGCLQRMSDIAKNISQESTDKENAKKKKPLNLDSHRSVN